MIEIIRDGESGASVRAKLNTLVDLANDGHNPSLTYSNDQLTRIDFADGSHKTLTYDGDKLIEVRYQKGGSVRVKTLIYTDDKLTSVIETTE